MALDVYIIDGEGSRRRLGVLSNGAIKVTTVPAPASDLVESGEIQELAARRILTGYFKDDADSEDQLVDGSSTPQDFYVEAIEGVLRIVNQVRFLIAGKGMLITQSEARAYSSSFPAGLTNGIRFFADQDGEETDLFIEPVTEILNYYDYQTEIINDAGAFAPNTDTLIVIIDLPVPVYLVPGLVDRLVVRIQDDFAGAGDLAKHQAIFFGTQESL